VRRAYSIETAPALDDAQLGELAGVVRGAARAGSGIEVCVGEDRGIDAVVDHLRARGVGIRSLAEKKISLEEVFLNAIDDNERGAA